MTTILIVEDNDLNLKLAKDLLQMAGLKVLEAQDADTGIQLARKHRPNLILMDMYLPVKSGYEATATLKADAATRDIPVIAFTALVLEQEKEKALMSGCSGFISKPIDVEHFTETVLSFLDGKAPLLPEPGPARQTHLPDSSANQDVEEFFMIVSHDLQAPLRKIGQLTGLLKRSTTSQFSPKDFDLLERIEGATQQMHELISDMLTLSRVNRRGKLFQPVDLSIILEEAIRDNQSTIDMLEAKIEIGEMIRLEADPIQMQQVFQALIENSLKFHQDDVSPVITIHSKQAQGDYEITVQDNGIGFSEEHRETIFKPFIRLHGSSSRYAGRGMGLTIAQKIVQRHGGRITAKSQPGMGSTFTVRLPGKSPEE